MSQNATMIIRPSNALMDSSSDAPWKAWPDLMAMTLMEACNDLGQNPPHGRGHLKLTETLSFIMIALPDCRGFPVTLFALKRR